MKQITQPIMFLQSVITLWMENLKNDDSNQRNVVHKGSTLRFFYYNGFLSNRDVYVLREKIQCVHNIEYKYLTSQNILL